METVISRQPRSVDLEVHLGYLLRRVSNHVSGAFADGLKAKRTSVAEWVALCRVNEHPGITPGELARDLDLTRGAISKVIDKLEAKNWIARSTKREDIRVQLLSLTRAGRRILPELVEIADRNDEAFFDALDENEKRTLRRLLVRLSELHQITSVPVE